MKIPADAQRIDVSGKYIIPGLWDMHAHYEQVEWGPIYLAAGVTTVRDVGNEYDFITQVRDAVNSGKALGPHMLLAGIVDGDSPYAIGITRVNNAADAEKWVTRYHDSGLPADQDLQLGEAREREGDLRRRAQVGHDRHRPHSERHERLRRRGGWHGHDQPHPLHHRPAHAEGFRLRRKLRGSSA